MVDKTQMTELLYQALETEMGGQKLYEASVAVAVNEDLKEEWTKYLEETRTHEQILLGVFGELGLDPARETPGREVVRLKATTLVKAIEMASTAGDPKAAERVAAECVVEAESKDHQNWELIGRLAEKLTGNEAKVLQAAYDEVAEQEAEHLFHTMGWARELWIDALGMPAVLPPPEEQKSVTTQIGAGRAEKAREDMLPRRRAG
jgi:rubrerythrin